MTEKYAGFDKICLITCQGPLKSSLMKGIIPVLLTLCLCPTFAIADGPSADMAEPDRNLYIGLYLTQPNIRMTATGLPQSELYASGFGFGFSVGKIIFDGIGLELDADTRHFTIETNAQKNEMTNATMTVGSSWGRQFFGRIRLYGGAGIGPSFWFNRVVYEPAHMDKRTAKVDFTYQAKFGAAMLLTERFDLDLNLKLQNLGRSGSAGPDFSMVGSISLVELRLGIAYKFGI
ncbi:MAG: outer membrane beta-barrel protein [Alphaproteobacteria bacterium]|nr:outer membrane beta-barrel protein [Alphaproteobacteria bacterium]